MSFAQSFYADQKKVVEQPQQQAPLTTAAIPAQTPIAEDALTPAQIQEAIRIYRSVLSSNSAPSSPVHHRAPVSPAVVEKPEVHSNYYGGGPTDIPQSYLLNYTTTTSPAKVAAQEPVAQEAQAPVLSEQQLIAQLQALQMQQQQVEPVYETAPVVEEQKKVAPKKAPVLQKMYDDEESGYCFTRNKEEEEEATPTLAPTQVQAPPPQLNSYSPAPVANNHNYSRGVCGPSEYIGMANDNKFIYDAQKALPMSYATNNSYTVVNPSPAAAPIAQPNFEDSGVTTTEDVTQVPASPAVTSRFRGMIRNASTPIQVAPAPIVVERVEPTHNYNNFGAFMPVNQNSMESEYQLPVLNDLASCIEHY